MRVSTFRMASNDSDDLDNEVALYFSQTARKPPSTGRGLSDLTCMGLVQYLGKWDLSQQVCKALKGLCVSYLASYSRETKN